MSDDLIDASGRSYVRKGKCESAFCSARPARLLSIDLMSAHGVELPSLAADLESWVVQGTCPMCPDSDPDGGGPDFDAWEDVLDDGLDQTLAQVTEEVFFVLFANRDFLYEFNLHLAALISSSSAHEALLDSGLFEESSERV